MADSRPHLDAHPTDRLVGTSAAMVALRGQIRHLASFDAWAAPPSQPSCSRRDRHRQGLVARVLHDSGREPLARSLR